MRQAEGSESKERLTHEQLMKIQTYPTHWQGTLLRVAKPGESIDGVYDRSKAFEDMM